MRSLSDNLEQSYPSPSPSCRILTRLHAVLFAWSWLRHLWYSTARWGVGISGCKSAEGEVANCWACHCCCSGSCRTTQLFTVKDGSKLNWLNMWWVSTQAVLGDISTHRVESHRPRSSAVISGYQWGGGAALIYTCSVFGLRFFLGGGVFPLPFPIIYIFTYLYSAHLPNPLLVYSPLGFTCCCRLWIKLKI